MVKICIYLKFWEGVNIKNNGILKNIIDFDILDYII